MSVVKLINSGAGDLAVDLLVSYGYVANVPPQGLAERAMATAKAMEALLEEEGWIDTVDTDDPTGDLFTN